MTWAFSCKQIQKENQKGNNEKIRRKPEKTRGKENRRPRRRPSVLGTGTGRLSVTLTLTLTFVIGLLLLSSNSELRTAKEELD